MLNKGDPYVSFCLSVLREAKRGNTLMWQDFKMEYNVNGLNHNSFEVAVWVAGWLTGGKNGSRRERKDYSRNKLAVK